MDRKKGFLGKLIDKIDKRMVKKAKEEECCCSSEDDSCCK